MEKPVLVEVIAYAPTAFYHCQHCEVFLKELDASRAIHNEQVEASLPDELTQDYQTISDWADALFRRYPAGSITLKVIDVASLEGVVKTLQYRLRRYPAVVVTHPSVGHRAFSSQALERARAEIARILENVQAAAG